MMNIALGQPHQGGQLDETCLSLTRLYLVDDQERAAKKHRRACALSESRRESRVKILQNRKTRQGKGERCPSAQ